MDEDNKRPIKSLFFLLLPAFISIFWLSKSILVIVNLLLIVSSYFFSFNFKKNNLLSILISLIYIGGSFFLNTVLIHDLPQGNTQIQVGATFTSAIVYLWYYQKSQFRDQIIAALCLFVFLFSGNSYNDGKSPYTWFAILFTPCILTFLIKSGTKIKFFSKGTRFFTISSLILILGLSFAFDKLIYVADSEFSKLIDFNFIPANTFQRVGLSSGLDIRNHVSLKQSTRAVLSIKSPKKITYLRAEVLTKYNKNKWSNPRKKKD